MVEQTDGQTGESDAATVSGRADITTTVNYGIAYAPSMVDMASFWGDEDTTRTRIARFPHEGRTLVKQTRTVIVTEWELVEADALAVASRPGQERL